MIATDAYAYHATRRLAVEREIAGELSPDPVRLAPIAREYGVTPASIDAEDLRLIIAGWYVAAAEGISRDAMLPIIERALRHAGCWSSTDAGTPPHWTAEALRRLVDGYYPAPSILRDRCRELLDLDRREQRAAEHLAESRRHEGIAMAILRHESLPTHTGKSMLMMPFADRRGRVA